MAELIDKIQDIMCKSCTDCETNRCDGEDKIKCRWLREIADAVTTTEAEIRAKAIDEFAEKLHELCGVEIGEYQYTDLLHESWIDEIAQQLKERD